MKYWHAYHPAELVAWHEDTVLEKKLTLHNERIHVEKYSFGNNSVIIFCPGLVLYSKMLIGIAKKFSEKNFDVVIFDPPGEGLSSGKRNFFTISETTEVIHKIIEDLKKDYDHIFLSGISLGGATAYFAGSSHADVSAMSIINVFDFSKEQLNSLFYSQPKLSKYSFILPVLNKAIPSYALNLGRAINFPKRKNREDTRFQKIWQSDPIAKNNMTIRKIHSLLNTRQAVPFEKNITPILVANQERDRLLNPEATKKNFEKLSGEKKYIILKEQPHWSISNDFWDPFIKETDNWFKKQM